MSLFSRIIKVLRAQVGNGAAVSRDDELFYDEFMRKRGGARKNAEEQERIRDAYENLNDSYEEEVIEEEVIEIVEHDHVLAKLYANLEVPYGSDLETVRQGWKTLLRKYHPDLQSSDPEKQRISNELVQQINAAFRELERHLKK